MKAQVLTIDARMLMAGGIGTYLQNLLKRLRFEELGLKVVVYVHNDAQAAWMRQYQPEADIRHCPHWIYGFAEQFFWAKHLRGGAFWAPHYNIPWVGYDKLIVTLHDAALPLTPHTPLIYNIYSRVMYWRIRQKANAILTVSEFSRHASQEKGGILGIPMTVTLLGVDPTWFTSTKPASPYPFRYLVYVGNLKPHKNLTRLLQAFQKVDTDLKLVCVGPFRKLKSRDNRAHQLMRQMSDRVIFTDELTGEPLRAVVKNAEGLVLPSTYEGFGLPPLEAMASRVPVLASWALPMPEVCGKSPIYCDPYSVDSIAEGLRELINLKGEERQRRVDEGYEHASQFNWDKTAAQTMEVFRKTLL